MKKNLRAYLILSLLAIPLSLSAQAEEKDHPCKEIKEACESAGYTKGGHAKDKKGLHIDCMKKLAAGEKVEGVTIDPAQIAACKTRREEHRSRKKQ